jgi:hypothetical protein
LVLLHLEVTLSDYQMTEEAMYIIWKTVGGTKWLRTNNVAFPVPGIARSSINRRPQAILTKQNKTKQNRYFF